MKKVVGLMVLLLGFFLLTTGCEKAKMTEGPAAPEASAGGETMPTGGSVNAANLMIHTAGGKAVNVPVEIAATDDERMKGLMGRSELPFKTGGMWFVFPEEVKDPFWMKDTTISLDIIFVGPDMKIVDVKTNTTPNSEDKLYPMKDGQVAAYRYVLEVGSGFAATNSVVAGDTVMLGVGPQ